MDELDKDVGSLAEQLRKAADKVERINFNLLRESTISISNALQRYSTQVEAQIREVEEADRALRTTRLANDRLRRSYGQFADGIVATYKIQQGRIAQVKQEVVLVQKQVTQIEALLNANQGALQVQQEKTAEIRRERDLTKELIARKQQERLGISHLIELKKQEADEIRARLESNRESERYTQSQIGVVQSEIDASQRKIDGYRVSEEVQKSEIDAVREQIRSMTGGSRGNIKKKLTEEELRQVSMLEAQQAEMVERFKATKEARKAEIDHRSSLASSLTDLEQQASEEAARSADYSSALAQVTEQQNELRQEHTKYSDEISSLIRDAGDLSVEITKSKQKEKLLNDERTGLASAYGDATQELQTKRAEELNTKIKAFQETTDNAANKLSKIASGLDKLVSPVLALQKEFGVSAGTAAKIKFSNLKESVDSYIGALMGKGPAVSTAEIEATQAAFREEFGGLLTSEAATDLAKEAKRMGVSAGEMAKARRVFMTSSMGDAVKAKEATDKFVAEFAKKGLTAKDAMAAIGQNSELLARNGTRFATSFARAAADAKKIGVDLSKVDQVGDNIIGNFEGFLESQAELGAMGFGFDTSRLAELAETGDTGALMNELRSQLASTGKDITKLRRSEQLALSQAFGMSIEDLQRMAGPTAGAGEETVSPEDLQKDANKSLGQLVFSTAAMVGILGAISYTLNIIAGNTAGGLLKGVLSKLGPGGGGLPGAGAIGAIKGMPFPTTMLGRVGLGVGLGAAGGLATAGGEKLKEAGYEKTGATVSTVGEIAKYAGLGAMFGPVGMAVGGLVGAVIGITNNFDAWKEMISNAFGAVSGAFTFMGEKIIGAAKWLFDAFMTLNPVSLIHSLFSEGIGGTVSKVKSLFGFGDDVVSKSGYGERTLVTPTQAVALNNNDTVVAYADDLISNAASTGIRTFGYGQLAEKQTQSVAPVVNVDLSRLEAKLDQVVRAIGSMDVNIDGIKAGRILVNSSQAGSSVGALRGGKV